MFLAKENLVHSNAQFSQDQVVTVGKEVAGGVVDAVNGTILAYCQKIRDY